MNRTLRSPAETDGLQLAQTLFASSILTFWRLGEHLILGITRWESILVLRPRERLLAVAAVYAAEQ